MAYKVVKIPTKNSRRGASYMTGDLLDFTIPDDGIYDLSKSYISLHAHVDTTPALNDTLNSIYNVSFNNPVNQELYFKNNILISEARANTRFGTLDDVRNVNLVQTTLDQYTMSTDDRSSNTYNNLIPYRGQNISDQLVYYSPFREFYREGHIWSKNVNARLPIMLSDCGLGIGYIQNYPAISLGKTQLQFKLDTTKIEENLVVNEFSGTSGISLKDITNASSQDLEIGIFVDGSLNNEKELPLITVGEFYDNSDISLWIGGAISITYTSNGSSLAGFSTISRIYKLSDGTISIYTETSLGTLGANDTITNVKLGQRDATGASLIIDDVELVLVKRDPMDKEVQQMINGLENGNYKFQYIRWTQEFANSPAGATSYNKYYDIEPSCINAYLFTQYEVIEAMSSRDQVNKYRFRVNDIDVTTRDIEMNKGIELDMKIKTFNNDPIHKLKNLDPVEGGITTNIPKFMPCLPIPLSLDKQTLQVTMDATAGMAEKTVVLCKQVVRTVSISKYGVTIN